MREPNKIKLTELPTQTDPEAPTCARWADLCRQRKSAMKVEIIRFLQKTMTLQSLFLSLSRAMGWTLFLVVLGIATGAGNRRGLAMADASQAATAEAVIDANGQVNRNDPDLPVSYGAGCSWPMQYDHVTREISHGNNNNHLGETISDNPLGFDHRQFAYKEFLQGCTGKDDENLQGCRQFEVDRIQMNLVQPSISQNYTHAGFAKVDAPVPVMNMLNNLWHTHSKRHLKEELWERSNTYLNHWDRPTYMLDVEHPEYGLSLQDRTTLINEVQSVLEAWTQQPLTLTSLYGIRSYGRNAVLAPHVDRLPLVASAIVNVAQDVEEAWVLEVIGHDGLAHNITMNPGDMVLYEGHSIIHGRPFPLQGEYFANLFVHFEPLGHSWRHMQNLEHRQQGGDNQVTTNHDDMARLAYERAFARQKQEYDTRKEKSSQALAVDGDYAEEAPSPQLPQYVHPSMEGPWMQRFEYEKETQISPKPTTVALGAVNVHHVAADGMLSLLKEIAARDRSQLFKADHNGWRPLHEAARGGRADTVAYLLKEGAEVNERTNHGRGGNALYWAEQKPQANAKTIAILKEHGAVSLKPKSLGDKKENEKNK